MDKFDDVVVSTRIRLARNINNLPFPRRLNGQEDIYNVLMVGVQKTCDKFFKSSFYKMSDLSQLEAEQLIEQHLISQNLVESKYGACFISENQDFSIMVNEEDHIRAQYIMKGFGFEEAYNKISAFDDELGKNLDIAFDARLGYLTSCPTNLGSAMRASAMLFLPALSMSGKIENYIAYLQENGITTRGMYGEGSKSEGYMYQVSNQSSISLSETDIVKKMINVVNTLINAERKEREILVKRRGLDLEDEIMRSFGVLKYACKMSSSEFNINIAMVKLGMILGYIDLDVDKVNGLMVTTQPAMLCKMLNNKLIAPEQRDVIRAKIIKKILA